MWRASRPLPTVCVVVVTALLTACTATDHGRAAAGITSPSNSERASSPATTAPSPEPSLDVPARVADQIGASSVQAAWSGLRSWVLATGYEPELVATTTPTADQLASVVAWMTDTGADDVRRFAAEPNPTNTGNLETLTAIGVRAPDATLLTGEGAVTDRRITQAAADLDSTQQLAVTVFSQAILHYRNDTDGHRVHSTFERKTTYTLVFSDAVGWRVTTWQGTYTTSDAVAE